MYTQKDIQKMSRRDLLEILVLQSKKIDELQEKLEEANNLLNAKQIMLSKIGSIAEASLALNKVFETAEESAKQYLDNIKRIESEQTKILQKMQKEYEKKHAHKEESR